MSNKGGIPIAAVTGASRGIGRATALALAGAGYRVFALARSEADLESLKAEASRYGRDVIPVRLDIANEASRREAASSVFERTGGYGVDVLVNNAGYGQLGPIEEISVDRLRRQLEVNVVGLLGFTQAFLPAMRERRHGAIVNVGSIAGRVSSPFTGAYSASKFALEALNDAMRLELGPFGLRVILIAPGPIRTEFGAVAEEYRTKHSESPYDSYMNRYRLSREGAGYFERSPEAVARVVVRALRSPFPRPRYTITLPAKLGASARRLVPDMVTDWAFRRAMGSHVR